MASITIRLDNRLKEQLARALSETDVTLSQFARAALIEKLEREPAHESPFAAWQRIFSGGSSGRTDLSQNHKRLYREKLRARHSRRRRALDRTL
jgi:predicted transcriptional regulator